MGKIIEMKKKKLIHLDLVDTMQDLEVLVEMHLGKWVIIFCKEHCLINRTREWNTCIYLI